MTQKPTYSNFQLSADGVGLIVTGLSDLGQCIDLILKTVPGSDPFRPFFGCKVWDFIDAPVNLAIPNMKNAIYHALNIWEPRIKILRISHQLQQSNILFTIVYRLLGSDITQTALLAVGHPEADRPAASSIVLTADLPPLLANGVYRVFLTLNSRPAIPLIPQSGFASQQQMLQWLQENWGAYGSWHLSPGKLVLYPGQGMKIKTADLRVSQTNMLTAQALIPDLQPGNFYRVVVLLDGKDLYPEFPKSNINNPEGLLLWIKDNWNHAGNWSIKNQGIGKISGDFSDDFSDDFSKTKTTVIRTLVLQTDKYQTATLIFK